jgi:hypothetical protein
LVTWVKSPQVVLDNFIFCLPDQAIILIIKQEKCRINDKILRRKIGRKVRGLGMSFEENGVLPGWIFIYGLIFPEN